MAGPLHSFLTYVLRFCIVHHQFAISGLTDISLHLPALITSVGFHHLVSRETSHFNI
jgi:hypothetical protein